MERAWLRMTSIRAGYCNMTDEVDWFLHTRSYWLWPFAEQALVFMLNASLGRQDYTLYSYTSPAPPTSPVREEQDMQALRRKLEEDGLEKVVASAQQIPPDSLRRPFLLMVQDILRAALDAFSTAQGPAAAHIPSTRLLLTVAAASLSGVSVSVAPPMLSLHVKLPPGAQVVGRDETFLANARSTAGLFKVIDN